MEELKDNISKSLNIYDIYIFIYDYLKRNSSSAHNAFDEEYEDDIKWYNFCNRLIDELDVKLNDDIKDKIINTIPSKKMEELNFLIVLFKKLDYISIDYYSQGHIKPIEDDGSINEVDCLNSLVSRYLGKVYFKENNFLQDIIQDDDRFKLDDYIGDHIGNYQKNLIIAEKRENDYEVKMFKVSSEYVDDYIYNHEGDIKLAQIPFVNLHIKDILVSQVNKKSGSWRYKMDKSFISFGGYIEDKEKIYCKYIINVLKRLIKKQVDIVVFPEMVMTVNIIKEVRKFLRDNPDEFLLLIMGTVWIDNENYCISLFGNGKEIGKQYKLNRFKIDNFYEDIKLSSENKIINLYDIKGIGRISTPICVDYVTRDYFDILLNYGNNISFIPAYTSSLNNFKRNAENLGSRNFGMSIISNCCGAIKNGEVSFTYIPKKGKSFYINEKGYNCLKCNKCNKLNLININKKNIIEETFCIKNEYDEINE